MANKYSDALLAAIDIIAKQRVKEAEYDKTIIAEVVTKQANGSYLLKYDNAFIEAFSTEELAPSIMVYVLIPQSNMGEEKQIIGRVNFYNQQKQTDEESLILWEETKGVIVKNNSIMGFIDNNYNPVYFDKKEV